MNNPEVNKMQVSVKQFSIAIAGLAFIMLTGQMQSTNNLPVIFPGGIAFGPETFVRSTSKPTTIVRNFSIANPDANYFIQIQNGENDINRVSSAILKLNGNIIISPNDFNQNIAGISKSLALQQDNTLEVELQSMPNSKLTITMRRAMLNAAVSNSKNDFVGRNFLEGIGLVWDRENNAAEYVLFHSDSIGGPFIELNRIPAGINFRTNANDITPDARAKTLCYKLEAKGTNGRTIRVYDPICVRPHVPNPHELENLSKRIFPGTFCLNKTQFIDTSALSLNDIRSFLQKWDSFLIRQDKDIDGVPIDPAVIIANSSIEFGISSQVIIGILERESAAITRIKPPSNTTLSLIMGFDLAHPTTIRQQIRDGIAQYRRDFDRLTGGQPTTGGWQIGIAKMTLDNVNVTPRTKVSAGMFSYDPEAGIGWGGNTGAGGNFFFCWSWASFDFPIPPQPVKNLHVNNVTANSVSLAWDLPDFPDPDIKEFRIFRSTISPVTSTSTLAGIVSSSTLSFTDTGLTPNTELFYRIFTVDQDNLSSASNEVSAKTLFSQPPGTWQSVGPMTTERAEHTSTLLNDGRVLITGGFKGIGSTFSELSSAEVFNPNTNTFSSVGNMSTPRAFHTATLLPNGNVLITGGTKDGGNTILNSAELFNPQTNAFTSISNLNQKRFLHTADILPSGKVLIAGSSGGQSLKSTEIFDLSTNTFSPGSDMIKERGHHASAKLNDGRILLVNGLQIGSLMTVEIYDPNANTFALATSSVFQLGLGVVTLPNGNVFISGSILVSQPAGLGAEIFNPNDSSFTEVGPMLFAINGSGPRLASVLLDNGTVLITGDGSKAQVFNPQTNAFKLTGNFIISRLTRHRLTLLQDGRVLLTGGQISLSGFITTNSAEVFKP